MTELARVRASNLLVIYTERLEACRGFYAGIGLPLVRERHGGGPEHYAAELPGGLVIELYPGRPERSTGRLRLGFTVTGGDLARRARPDRSRRADGRGEG